MMAAEACVRISAERAKRVDLHGEESKWEDSLNKPLIQLVLRQPDGREFP